MGLQFLDGWPRLVLGVLGLLVIGYLVATKQWPPRRRRYHSAWDAPADPPLGPSRGFEVGDTSRAARMPMGLEHRPFRRTPRSQTEAVSKFLVFVTALAALGLIAWAAFEFLTNLPGWS